MRIIQTAFFITLFISICSCQKKTSTRRSSNPDVNIEQCPEGLVRDDNNQCVYTESYCTERGLDFDNDSKKCTEACAENLIKNEDGDCIVTADYCNSIQKDFNANTTTCIDRCADGMVRGDNYNCIETAESCSNQDKDFNPDSNTCIDKCADGMVRDDNYNCIETAESCNNQDKDFDNSNYTCIDKCPEHMERNNDGICITTEAYCTNQGQNFDPVNLRCEDACIDGFVKDANGSCVVTETYCTSNGMEFDQSTTTCIQPCEQYMIRDESGTCIVTQDYCTNQTMEFDSSTNTCIEPCEENMVRNDAGTCVITEIYCTNLGKDFDPVNLLCSEPCADGLVKDDNGSCTVTKEYCENQRLNFDPNNTDKCQPAYTLTVKVPEWLLDVSKEFSVSVNSEGQNSESITLNQQENLFSGKFLKDEPYSLSLSKVPENKIIRDGDDQIFSCKFEPAISGTFSDDNVEIDLICENNEFKEPKILHNAYYYYNGNDLKVKDVNNEICLLSQVSLADFEADDESVSCSIKIDNRGEKKVIVGMENIGGDASSSCGGICVDEKINKYIKKFAGSGSMGPPAAKDHEIVVCGLSEVYMKFIGIGKYGSCSIDDDQEPEIVADTDSQGEVKCESKCYYFPKELPGGKGFELTEEVIAQGKGGEGDKILTDKKNAFCFLQEIMIKNPESRHSSGCKLRWGNIFGREGKWRLASKGASSVTIKCRAKCITWPE